MGLLENVVLMRNESEKTVYQRIMNFLKDKGNDSKKTYIAYETDIKDFFRVVLKGREIESLTEEDILKIDNDDVIAYKNMLAEVGYAATSINRKISSVRSLYHILSASLDGVSEDVFNVTRAKGKSNSWGALSWDETKEMIKRVKRYENGYEKSLIIETAARTGFRIGSILSLEWNDITFDEKENLWIIHTHVDENGSIIGKGQKEDEKPVTEEFYKRLRKIRRGGEKKIFHISDKTCRRAIASLCEEMNIDPKRNIKFHSIKKMGVNRILDLTGDIRDAQRYANHKNGATTLNSYAKHDKSYGDMACLMIDKEVDMTALDSASAEQLLVAIRSCSESVQTQILTAFQKLTGK